MIIKARRVPKTSKSDYPVTFVDMGHSTVRLFDRQSEQLYHELKNIWEPSNNDG